MDLLFDCFCCRNNSGGTESGPCTTSPAWWRGRELGAAGALARRPSRAGLLLRPLLWTTCWWAAGERTPPPTCRWAPPTSTRTADGGRQLEFGNQGRMLRALCCVVHGVLVLGCDWRVLWLRASGELRTAYVMCGVCTYLLLALMYGVFIWLLSVIVNILYFKCMLPGRCTSVSHACWAASEWSCVCYDVVTCYVYVGMWLACLVTVGLLSCVFHLVCAAGVRWLVLCMLEVHAAISSTCLTAGEWHIDFVVYVVGLWLNCYVHAGLLIDYVLYGMLCYII